MAAAEITVHGTRRTSAFHDERATTRRRSAAGGGAGKRAGSARATETAKCQGLGGRMQMTRCRFRLSIRFSSAAHTTTGSVFFKFFLFRFQARFCYRFLPFRRTRRNFERDPDGFRTRRLRGYNDNDKKIKAVSGRGTRARHGVDGRSQWRNDMSGRRV